MKDMTFLPSTENNVTGKIRATPPSGMNTVISLNKAQNAYSVYMEYKISWWAILFEDPRHRRLSLPA